MDATVAKEAPVAPIYTHGKFWGGTVLPYWVFLFFTAFPITGLLGIDHLLFRSPSTAMSKFFTNIFTLGLWYFYDMIQAFSDRQYVNDYGFSRPFSGPAGLALDYFRGIQSGGSPAPESKSGFISILLFIAYSMTLFVPFGISSFIAGDTNGGIAKFLMSFGPWGLIWIPFLSVVAFYETYLFYMKTQDLFEKGVIRVPPITWFMDKEGFAPNLMNPASIEKHAAEKGKENSGDLYSKYIQPFLKMFGITDPMVVLDTTKCAVVPPVKETLDAAQTAGKGVIKIASKVPEIADKVTTKLTAFTDPEALKAAASLQKGGGSSSSFDAILLSGLLLIILGGLGASILRSFEHRRTEHDDTPPKPRTL